MKVEVKVRSDNERGLFAIDDITKGDLVCILPIDYFQLDNNWYVMNEYYLHDKIDFRYGILCELNKNGDEFQTFISLMKNKKWECFNYFIKVTKLEIIGVSNYNKIEDNFVGHMINDYVDMSFLNQKTYEKMSFENSNVKALPKLEIFDTANEKKLGLKIMATKDIKKGNELYLSYGSNYWKKYSGKEKFIYNIKMSVILVN